MDLVFPLVASVPPAPVVAEQHAVETLLEVHAVHVLPLGDVPRPHLPVESHGRQHRQRGVDGELPHRPPRPDEPTPPDLLGVPPPLLERLAPVEHSQVEEVHVAGAVAHGESRRVRELAERRDAVLEEL